MLGQPDGRDVDEWRAADPDVLRAGLDRALDGGTDDAGGGLGNAGHTGDGGTGGGSASSDAELIAAVRDGNTRAYGQLYARHVGAARTLARQLSRSPVEADDLVSDAFAKVLMALRAGRGPDSAFRPYLLTALRHTAYDRTRQERRLELAGDVEAVSGVERVASLPFHDTAVAELERSLAARAFASLPERWRAVLWHTEVEGQSHAEVAPLLGLTANGVSAMAYRAREGLRKAYLQAHVEQNPGGRCRAAVSRLGAWTRRGLSVRESAQVEAHLDECPACRALAAELADVSGALRGVVAPLVLGVGASGYLASAGTGSAALAGGAAAGGAAAGGAAAGNALAGGTAASGTAIGGGAVGGAVGSTTSSAAQWLGAAASAVAVAVVVVSGTATRDEVVPGLGADPTPTVANGFVPTATATWQPPAGSTSSPGGSPTDVPGLATTGGSPPVVLPPATTTTGAGATTPAAEPPGDRLTPTAPAGLSTDTGGPPTPLPVIVRNTGSTPLPPPVVTLSLPDDVRVVGAGNGLVGRRLVALDGADGQVQVPCPAGRGTVTCEAEAGLAPGESVTFLFRVLAGPKATGGEITGSVSAGAAPGMPVRVPVTITPKK
ncbi:sigma-70 family RNA polymerase sigma factor [Saccharothrix syringae]|uniref:Sigma-70 family RNA polymerase sigma factor n=1 Tax=Saccharothrix syringae TaxID=103733 RepID=A0A5Q0H5S6_SACSY|nr:sigma-70 family RNA polymerase sigma factor [Saccharothrix syringae]QFZ21547.1 sigma-70 family RNA polymerase sigma factor [Saccharothrix syringae]